MKKCKQIKTNTKAPERSPEPESSPEPERSPELERSPEPERNLELERNPEPEKSSTETCTTKKVTSVEKEIEAEKSENDDDITIQPLTKRITKGISLAKKTTKDVINVDSSDEETEESGMYCSVSSIHCFYSYIFIYLLLNLNTKY